VGMDVDGAVPGGRGYPAGGWGVHCVGGCANRGKG